MGERFGDTLSEHKAKMLEDSSRFSDTLSEHKAKMLEDSSRFSDSLSNHKAEMLEDRVLLVNDSDTGESYYNHKLLGRLSSEEYKIFLEKGLIETIRYRESQDEDSSPNLEEPFFEVRYNQNIKNLIKSEENDKYRFEEFDIDGQKIRVRVEFYEKNISAHGEPQSFLKGDRIIANISGREIIFFRYFQDPRIIVSAYVNNIDTRISEEDRQVLSKLANKMYGIDEVFFK